MNMPAEEFFSDKDGNRRTAFRMKWWEDPAAMTYNKISVEPVPNLSDTGIDHTLLPSTDFYKHEEKPVFFGHY